MNTKRIKELAALTDGELARKLLIQEFGNDSETHWGNNAHDERVMVTINPDGIAQRTWEANHWVRLDEFDKDGFYAREIYEGKWVDEPLPINVIARNVTIAAPKPIQQESKDTEILRAAQVLCKQLTGDDTFGWNPELLAQIADCTAALLATNGIHNLQTSGLSKFWEVRLLFYDERSFYEQPKSTGFAGHRVHQSVQRNERPIRSQRTLV